MKALWRPYKSFIKTLSKKLYKGFTKVYKKVACLHVLERTC